MTARAVSTNTPLRCPRKTPHVTKGESFRLDDNDFLHDAVSVFYPVLEQADHV